MSTRLDDRLGGDLAIPAAAWEDMCFASVMEASRFRRCVTIDLHVGVSQAVGDLYLLAATVASTSG